MAATMDMSPGQIPWPTIEEVEASDDCVQVMRWTRRLPSPATEAQVSVIDAVVKRHRELREARPRDMVAASKTVGL